MDKLEYLTGPDLGYKPGVFEQAKCEHSPIRGKAFNKELKENDKKERLLKRLKYVEDINKKIGKEIRNN